MPRILEGVPPDHGNVLHVRCLSNGGALPDERDAGHKKDRNGDNGTKTCASSSLCDSECVAYVMGMDLFKVMLIFRSSSHTESFISKGVR